jgi:hypothetical protein
MISLQPVEYGRFLFMCYGLDRLTLSHTAKIRANEGDPMKLSGFLGHAPMTLAVLMMVTGPMMVSSADAARRTVAGCGPRGCAAVSTVRRGAVVRPPVRRGVVVVNPRRYWRPGGAIAAGAAIGFVAGASAVAIAGSPPRSGYCWYYTNAARTTGFWDVCPG